MASGTSARILSGSLDSVRDGSTLPHPLPILGFGRGRRVFFWLRLVLAFLLLFFLQCLLLFGVFLQQLLGLLLMLQLDLLFFGGIRLLLRELGVFLLLLLLDCLAFLHLFRVELILFLLVLGVQLGVRRRWNNGPWRRRHVVGMGCRGNRRPIAWGRLRRVIRI